MRTMATMARASTTIQNSSRKISMAAENRFRLPFLGWPAPKMNRKMRPITGRLYSRPSARYWKVDSICFLDGTWVTTGMSVAADASGCTGSAAGAGAAAATVAAGNRPGAMDFLPGGVALKAVPLAIVQAAKKGLRHAGKITDRTANYVMEMFGEDGIKALDNYIERYPKVGTLSIPDAFKILNEARGGDVVPMRDVGGEMAGSKIFERVVGFLGHKNMDDFLNAARYATEKEMDNPEEAARMLKQLEDIGKKIQDAADRGDFAEALAINGLILGSAKYGIGPSAMAERILNGDYLLERTKKTIIERSKNGSNLISAADKADQDAIDRAALLNGYFATVYGTPQNLEKIESAQLRTEANRQAKEAKKAIAKESKPSQTPTVKNENSAGPTERELYLAKQAEEGMRRAEARAEQKAIEKAERKAARNAEERGEVRPSEILDEVVSEHAVEKVSGGPNRWRENGWNPAEAMDTKGNRVDYEAVLGKKNLTDEEKRDAFVLDSLAKHWAGKAALKGKPVGETWPGMSKFRHQNTNYGMVLGRPDIADRFIEDVQRNRLSGNMPGTSFRMYRKPGATNPMAKAIDVDGYDIYNALFRKKFDEVINRLEGRYTFDPYDTKYTIGGNKL